MSHAPTVDASEVSVDALLRELGLEGELRASCGDDAGQPTGAVVAAPVPGRPAALEDPAVSNPESCELVLRQPDVLCKPQPCRL